MVCCLIGRGLKLQTAISTQQSSGKNSASKLNCREKFFKPIVRNQLLTEGPTTGS